MRHPFTSRLFRFYHLRLVLLLISLVPTSSIPGAGRVSLNGEAVDGVVGTRSRSQYDIRSLYTTFDVAPLLRLGAANTLGVTIAGGWW